MSPYIDYDKTYGQLPPLPGLAAWMKEVMQDLVGQGTVTAPELERDGNGRLLPGTMTHYLRLERYLARSGKYSYSLALPRHDRDVDPVVDFLCNVRQGHCERFACGLTVMLRSEGIPARMVAGYRGVDNQGDGIYHVRQSHAHAWVEALVERPGPDGRLEHRWLTLDPTPGDDAEARRFQGLAHWWRNFPASAAAACARATAWWSTPRKRRTRHSPTCCAALAPAAPGRVLRVGRAAGHFRRGAAGVRAVVSVRRDVAAAGAAAQGGNTAESLRRLLRRVAGDPRAGVSWSRGGRKRPRSLPAMWPRDSAGLGRRLPWRMFPHGLRICTTACGMPVKS